MAIFQSILLGKSSGSAGNVTTCVLKGQNVAKQKVSKKGKIPVADRSVSQLQMSNAVKAWQFLAIFLAKISANRKSTESNYNAFIRVAKNFFSSIITVSGSLAAYQLLAKSLFNTNFIHIDEVVSTTDEVTVSFTTGGLPWVLGNKMRLLVFDSISGVNNITEVVVSAQDWESGSVVLSIDMISFNATSAYCYNENSKKCSNVVFFGI